MQVGQVLMLEEIRDPGTGRYKGADPAHRHPVRLTRVTRITDCQVEIEWGTDDALPFDLCLSASRDRSHRVTISVARGNIVLADYGLRVEDEPLGEVPPFDPALDRVSLYAQYLILDPFANSLGVIFSNSAGTVSDKNTQAWM